TSGVQLLALLAYFTVEGKHLLQGFEALTLLSIEVVN
ncbi:MAG: hypothetical protein QOI13_3685, partial [Paraburkholderia sp.]|nr:hypothetical protein [Paraburkholderia sp.]